MELNPNEVINQEAPTSTPPPIVNQENKPKKSYKSLFFLLGIFIFLILVGGIGSEYFLGKNTKSEYKQVNTTKVKTQTPTPTTNTLEEWEITNSEINIGWKKYMNTKIDYSFEAPSNWSVESLENDNIHFNSPDYTYNKTDGSSGAIIRMMVYDTKLTSIEDDDKSSGENPVTRVLINGTSAIRSRPIAEGAVIETKFIRNNKIYYLNIESKQEAEIQKYLNIYNQILSTIKFTN